MQYLVRALDDRSAQLLTLTLEALDEAAVHAQLRARQLTAISVSGRRAAFTADTHRHPFDVAAFAVELHALVRAGLSLVESLEALAEKEEAALTRAVLESLLASLREGQRFSAALRAHEGRFSPLFIGIVEAAESTGELSPALDRYIHYDQRVRAVRQRLVSAAIYPAILLTVGGLVALFLMGWVVPRFAAVYQGTGRALPWASRGLLEWGQFAAGHAVPLSVAVFVTLLVAGWKLRAVLRDADAARLLGWVPGVPRWLELMTLSRLYLTLGLLLRGGLAIHRALDLAASVLPPARRAALDRVRDRIAEGQPLSAAFHDSALTTSIALRFIRAGERSGQLAQMLHEAALYHDAQTVRWVERFSKTFEPLLMAAIGVVIGLIVLLLYMPIFDLAGSLQ